MAGLESKGSLEHSVHPNILERMYRRFAPHVEEHYSRWMSALPQVASHYGVAQEYTDFTGLVYALEQETYKRAEEISQQQPFTRVILVGPQNVGKTSLRLELIDKGFEHIPNFVTRAPRSSEVDGRENVFVTEEELREKERQGGLFSVSEQKHSSGEGIYYSAAPKHMFLEHIRQGRLFVSERQLHTWANMRDALLAEGVEQQELDKTLVVFLLPPSFESLALRAINRVVSAFAMRRETNVETAYFSPEVEQRILTEFERAYGKDKQLLETLTHSQVVFLVNDDLPRVVEKVIRLTDQANSNNLNTPKAA